MIPIAAIAFVAAVVNGALGFGFSTVAVPLCLLLVVNRDLSPAIVLLELVMNAYVLWTHRAALPAVWRPAAFVIVGLPVGVAVGTAALLRVDPTVLKLATFVVLLPLIVLQTAGFRRAVRAEQAAGTVLGAGVGILYAATTISGPPLAMFLANQGYAKEHFRAALGAIRFAAAGFALVFYLPSHVVTRGSISLLLVMCPCMLLGIPLGARLIRRVREESFRRLCMAVVATIVAFGLSTSLQAVADVPVGVAYIPLVLVTLVSVALLNRHFRTVSDTVVSCQ